MELVTVATFLWPTDAVVPQGILEHAGIPTFLKDEHTVQVHNLMAQAVGGVKLQVPRERVTEARQLLLEAGYLQAGPPESSALWLELDAMTKRLPLIGRIELFMARLLVLVALVLIVVITPIAISAQPSTAERLSAAIWCVERVQLAGRDVTVNTTEAFLIWEGCPNVLRFHAQGFADLPGFNSPAQQCSWRVEGELLMLADMTEPHPVFSEPLSVAVNDQFLTLSSPTVRIYCTRTSHW